MKEGKLWIGISGWTYAGWRGDFYPVGLPARQELEFASGRFNSIEINGSFYRLQHPDSYTKWREQTPADFRFAVKGSRFITHNKKLGGVEIPLANFFASGVLALGDKLGPILWQLSPAMRFDPRRIEEFFMLLPRTTGAAAQLAAKHDYRLQGRAHIRPSRNRRLRHALEPRHESFFDAEFARLCRRYKVAIVFSDSGSWPYTEEVTTDFVYLRLHGSEQTYASRYGDTALDNWASRIRLWRSGGQPIDARTFTNARPRGSSGRDVYVYFDNDAKVHAPKDAMRLASRLGL